MKRKWLIARRGIYKCGFDGATVPDGALVFIRELSGSVTFDRCEEHANQAGYMPTDEERLAAIAEDERAEERFAIDEADKAERAKQPTLIGVRRVPRPRGFSHVGEAAGAIFDRRLPTGDRE